MMRLLVLLLVLSALPICCPALAPAAVAAGAASASLVLSDTTAPGPVTGLIGLSGNRRITLSWTNPSDSDFTGTIVRYKTGSYPTSISDGNFVCDRTAAPGSADSFVHKPVSDYEQYYSVFAYDSSSNASLPARVHLQQRGGSILAGSGDHTIDGNPSDWEPLSDYLIKGGQAGDGGCGLVGYHNGKLYYGGRDASCALPVSAADHTARIYCDDGASWPDTSPYIYLLFRCDDDDIRGTNAAAANWANDCVRIFVHAGSDPSLPISNSTSDFELVIDAFNRKNVYCTTLTYKNQILAGVTSEVARDGSGWWLEVRLTKSAVDPDINTNATGWGIGMDFCFRDADGAGETFPYCDPMLSTVYSWSDWEDSASFPSLIPERWGAVVRYCLPYGPVRVFDDGAYTPSLTRLHATWGDGGSAVYNRYAIGTSPEGTDVVGWTEVGTACEMARDGLNLIDGQTYYISVDCSMIDEQWTSSWDYPSDGITVAPGASVSDAKKLDDNQARSLRNKVVTTICPGGFYVQEPGSYHGIKVTSSASVAPGNLISVAGPMKGAGAERYVNATGNPVEIAAPGPGLPSPLSLSLRSIGGAVLNGFSPGVKDGEGANNIGSHIRAWGKVTQRQPAGATNYLYISDGSAMADGSPLKDGTQTDGAENIGVRVEMDPGTYQVDDYVVVTGIVSVFDDGPIHLARKIIPVSIQKLAP